MFSHAQFLLIKHKKIFECFSCLWKVFCFCKNVKNFKNSVALFWRLGRGLVQSHAPSREATEKFFVTQISDLFVGGNSSREGYTEIFFGSLRNFLVGGTSSRENHLGKFFKNVVSGVSWLVLATCM